MIGVTGDTRKPLADIRGRIDRVSEEFGLEAKPGIDRVKSIPLPSGVVAQTRFDGTKTELVFNRDRFQRMPEIEKKRTVLHELLHVKQFNGTLSRWLRNRFGVSDDFLEEMNSSTAGDMEGEVELIIDKVLPRNLPSAYPEEKERREREMKQKGVEPEAELMEDIEELGDEIMESNVERGFDYGAPEIQVNKADNIPGYREFREDYSALEKSWSQVDSYLSREQAYAL